jgi:hypothetical protein
MAVQLFKSVMIETPLSHIKIMHGSVTITSGIEDATSEFKTSSRGSGTVASGVEEITQL